MDTISMDTVWIITFKKDGTVHMVVPSRFIAVKYCKENKDYEWECYAVQSEVRMLFN